jgi:hypothetical protein
MYLKINHLKRDCLVLGRPLVAEKLFALKKCDFGLLTLKKVWHLLLGPS